MTAVSAHSNELGTPRPTTFSRMFVGRPPSLAEVLAARNRAIAGIVDRAAEPATQQPEAAAEAPIAPEAPAAVAPAPAPAPQRPEPRMHGFPRRRRTTWSHYRDNSQRPAAPYTPPVVETPAPVETSAPVEPSAPVETTVFAEPIVETAASGAVDRTVFLDPPATSDEAVEAELVEATPDYPVSEDVARMMRGESFSPELIMNSLLSSMQRVVVARRDHGTAVEDEMLRRAEVIRAEAEVDAEFIRMRAYVDALSIVSQARTAVEGGAANESWSASVQPLAELVAKLHQEVG